MYSVEFFDVEMEELFSVGSHAWIIKIIVIKRKSFNWDRYISTQSSISQAGGSDSDSSVFSFSVTTPIVGYSGDTEWILDTGATYHVCPNRD